MFEFFFAKQYLWPKKRQLSVSLIGLLSVFVISLVIWLLILFISITEGIEQNWLTRLTSLNAPVRITPTEAYFNSYYYQVDAISQKANFRHKTIGEKKASPLADPYDPSLDEEIPFYWPSPIKSGDGEVNDFVKNAFSALESVRSTYPDLAFQDYEVSGALARFRLIRPEKIGHRENDSQSFLTQAAYVASFSNESKPLLKLITPPTAEDVSHLIYLSHLLSQEDDLKDRPEIVSERTASQKGYLQSILRNVDLEEVVLEPYLFEIPFSFLPEGAKLEASAKIYNNEVSYLILSLKKGASPVEGMSKGFIEKRGDFLVFTKEGKGYEVHSAPLVVSEPLTFKAHIKEDTLDHVGRADEILLSLSTSLQGVSLSGVSPFRNLTISKCRAVTHFLSEPVFAPPWLYYVGGVPVLGEQDVIIPMNFRDYHVLIGDRGFLSYGATTAMSIQEGRLPMRVVGFYDPGVMAVGARFFLAHKDLVRQISLGSGSVSLDPLLANGISVWIPSIKKTSEVALKLEEEFKRLGIDSYWKITPFYDYEFAKDFIGQFQSDRYLFLLVGIIILVVACSNIVSLLLLLVNDKKAEIGILLSLGAKKRSIAFIFGLCGISMGLFSCFIGALFAYFTLIHIDSLVHLLNLMEGQQAFNTAFYGHSLPNEISPSALLFVSIAAPILSLAAGLIPAIKACKLEPSAILRSE